MGSCPDDRISARLLGGADVGHVLRQLEDAIQVFGCDDGGYSLAVAGKKDRFVLGSDLIDKCCEPLPGVG